MINQCQIKHNLIIIVLSTTHYPYLTLGVCDYLCSIDDHTIRCHQESPVIVKDSYKDLADALVLRYDLPKPVNFKNALELYFCLLVLTDKIKGAWTRMCIIMISGPLIKMISQDLVTRRNGMLSTYN